VVDETLRPVYQCEVMPALQRCHDVSEQVVYALVVLQVLLDGNFLHAMCQLKCVIYQPTFIDAVQCISLTYLSTACLKRAYIRVSAGYSASERRMIGFLFVLASSRGFIPKSSSKGILVQVAGVNSSDK
jgi:hypothetical protein